MSDPMGRWELEGEVKRLQATLDGAVLIPKHLEARARLAQMAGLTDEERLAIDKWCAMKADEDAAKRRRGLEREGDRPMGGRSDNPAMCYCAAGGSKPHQHAGQAQGQAPDATD